MSHSNIHLAPVNLTNIKTVQPNLLPVHIPWDGSAQVSQYFLVKPAPEVETTLPTPDSETGETVTTQLKKSLKKRFLSAFRGRKMHGVEVDLPEGTTGLVLRTADPTSKERIERTIKRRRKQMNVDEDEEQLEENVNARYLEPVSKFRSFVHWNPDYELDESRDEYIQTLSQWRTLTSKVFLFDAIH